MSSAGAFQLVHPRNCGSGNFVHFSPDLIPLARKIDQERDAVRAADERILHGSAVDSDVGGVAGADHVLDEDVVGESLLERAVCEDQRSVGVCRRVHLRSCTHAWIWLDLSRGIVPAVRPGEDDGRRAASALHLRSCEVEDSGKEVAGIYRYWGMAENTGMP